MSDENWREAMSSVLLIFSLLTDEKQMVQKTFVKDK